MYLSSLQLIWLVLPALTRADTYAVPATAPAGSSLLEPAPVGISFEFFEYPSYFTNVTGTVQCLENFQQLTGVWPPIRIGGTTQDRATYDPATPAYVVYSVTAASAAPTALTFGSSFLSLAATYPGTVVLGLNRGHNNISNTIAAAQVAVAKMDNLIAIELGNEPEYYLGAGQAIAVASGTWTAADDAASQNNWDILVGQGVNRTQIIQAGNSLTDPPAWGAAELIATENATARSYVHDYAHHNYPGGSVAGLMSHSGMVNNVKKLATDALAAIAIGKQYVLGETNSVSGGGGATVCPTFGAGLWVMDYVVRVSMSGISRSYFHHGTLGTCYYCWWGRYDMGAPYYGAYVATEFMAGGAYIAALDTGLTAYAAYVVYSASNTPIKALLYNSDYYDATTTRGNQSFVLTGLTNGTTVKGKRLTAASALSRIDQGSNPSYGGQYFQNGTCVKAGTETFENTAVVGGQATFTLFSSEAMLLYL